MHGDHFTEHQPRIDRVAVGGGELNTLLQTALKVHRTLRDPWSADQAAGGGGEAGAHEFVLMVRNRG